MAKPLHHGSSYKDSVALAAAGRLKAFLKKGRSDREWIAKSYLREGGRDEWDDHGQQSASDKTNERFLTMQEKAGKSLRNSIAIAAAQNGDRERTKAVIEA